MRLEHLKRCFDLQPCRGEIEMGGELLGHALYQCEAQSDHQRKRDAEPGVLAGDLLIIPRHGRTAIQACT